MTNYKCLGQTVAIENKTSQDVSTRTKAILSVFGKNRFIFLDWNLPMSLKRKVFNQCLTSNGIWMSSQRAIERKMLNVKLKYIVRNTIIRQRISVTEKAQCITNAKWK